MNLSIIIVNYNSEKLLEKCLASIIESKPDMKYEIIVVDNGSQEPPKIKGSSDQRIKLLVNKENNGFGAANNQAVKKAEGKYILLLNVDTEVIDGAISKLYTFVTSHKKVDIAGCTLLNIDATDQPSCGPFYSLPVTFGMLFLRGDTWGLTRWSPAETKKVDWISGACIMMKKKDYERLNGFDEGIFMYMEEVELLYRAQKAGLHVYFYPDARIMHVGSATSKSRTDPILNIYRGLLYFYKKHANGIQYNLMKAMLRIKAYGALIVGMVTNNTYLTSTYKKALSYL